MHAALAEILLVFAHGVKADDAHAQRYIMLACLVLGLVGEVLSPVVNWFYGWMSQAVFFVFGVA